MDCLGSCQSVPISQTTHEVFTLKPNENSEDSSHHSGCYFLQSDCSHGRGVSCTQMSSATNPYIFLISQTSASIFRGRNKTLLFLFRWFLILQVLWQH